MSTLTRSSHGLDSPRDTTVRPCQLRPAHWWDTGDSNNWRAISICLSCPFAATCTAGPRPVGIIVAGVAYGDDARPVPLHHCGQPLVRRPERSHCTHCDARPSGWRQRSDVLDRIATMRAAHCTWAQVADALGTSVPAAQHYWRRHRTQVPA